jgi:hypothetical protein
MSLPVRYVTPDGLSLGNWVQTQRKIRSGRQQGTLSQEQIDRLDAIGMVWDNRLELKFQQNFAYAKAYFERYGDLLVPTAYQTENGFKLGAWISKLREQYANGEKAGVLSPERIKQLNSIGMCWDVLSYNWEKNFAEAFAYYKEHGDLNVPAKYRTASGFALGTWLANLRSARAGKNRQTPPTPEQIARLDVIGMRWGSRFEEQWQKSYRAAKRYFERYGTLDNLPADYQTPEGVALGRWLCGQKYAIDHPEKSTVKLTEERIRLLGELGIAPAEKEDAWTKALCSAERYQEKFGTLDMGQDAVFEGFRLGKWLTQQRKAYQQGKLTQQQVQSLDALGFNWKSRAEQEWDRRYAEAERYRRLNGALNVSPSSRGLGRWLQLQRSKRRQGHLTQQQIARLDELGMSWGRQEIASSDSLPIRKKIIPSVGAQQGQK